MKKVYKVGVPTKGTPIRSDLVPWDNDYSFYPSLTIFEEDDGPFDTGLLDESGQPIVYYMYREPIGFRVE